MQNRRQTSSKTLTPSRRYGKPSLPLLLQKTSFFEENDILAAKQAKIARVYRKQPRRTRCMNCAARMDGQSDFVKNGIDYLICSRCQHLNGAFECTEEFCNGLYAKDSGEDYAKTFYKVENIDRYNYRMASIYVPKAEFLCTSLLNDKVDPYGLEYFDFGAGSGYFVAALKNMGLKNVGGSDISRSQVEYGNAMLAAEYLHVHDMNETDKILADCTAQVVSLIGVLEHLHNPRAAIAALRSNPNVKYVFILVPTFSLSVFLEILSPGLFHRHLTGGHTHLYSRASLEHLCSEFGFAAIAEWWFGTDMVDLFRHITVTMHKQNFSPRLKERWRREFMPLIDALQLEVDKNHFSSEVHMLWKKQ